MPAGGHPVFVVTPLARVALLSGAAVVVSLLVRVVNPYHVPGPTASDVGPEIDETAAARAGRRGLADMRAEARACGAALDIGRGDGGRGTAVSFRWPG
jgi:hypothetical protein